MCVSVYYSKRSQNQHGKETKAGRQTDRQTDIHTYYLGLLVDGLRQEALEPVQVVVVVLVAVLRLLAAVEVVHREHRRVRLARLEAVENLTFRGDLRAPERRQLHSRSADEQISR